MNLNKLGILIITITLGWVNCTDNKKNTTEETKTTPSSVDSRFFDLSGVIGQLFPGFNQGNQGGQGGNPGGMGFPGNSQFYPTGSTQGPQTQGNGRWPVIDDANNYPNQNNNIGGSPQQTQYPGFQQYPNQGGIRGQPTTWSQQPQQGGFGGGQSTWPQQPQQPQQGGFGGGQSTWPQQTQTPQQGGFGGGQSTWPQQPQQPQQGGFGGGQSTWPQQTQPPQQGGFGGGQSTWPQQTQPPQQGGFQPQDLYPEDNDQGQNNFRPGSGINDGTLNGLMPPGQNNQDNLNFPDNGQQQIPGQGGWDNGSNAILGNPVIVPTTTTPAGQIFFPQSTEDPNQKQCVQDCQTTTEYSPVCGSNNVTYFNTGRFICARNCGVNVFVVKKGNCTPPPQAGILVTTESQVRS